MKIFSISLLLVSSVALADAGYSVPVPVELAAQASFSLQNLEWKATPSGQMLKYSLPEDLVGGKAIEIQLFGEAPVLGNGLSPFSGELASGGCTLSSAGKALCLVQYKLKTFGTDPEVFEREAREFLEAKYAGSPELPLRLKIQRIFKNEPAGLVNLEIH